MKKCIVSTISENNKSEDNKLYRACQSYLFPNGQPLLKLHAEYILSEVASMVRAGVIEPIHYELILRKCSDMSGYSVTEFTDYNLDIESEKYNGHKNYQTWNVSLWINNDMDLYRIAAKSENYKEFADRLLDVGVSATTDNVSWSDEDLDFNALNELIESIA